LAIELTTRPDITLPSPSAIHASLARAVESGGAHRGIGRRESPQPSIDRVPASGARNALCLAHLESFATPKRAKDRPTQRSQGTAAALRSERCRGGYHLAYLVLS
jgi:hypothetical protein